MKRTCIIYFDVENDTYLMSRDFETPLGPVGISDIISSMLCEISAKFDKPVIKSILFSESRDV